MDIFQWNKKFETGLAEVDKQHQHLVNVINDFSKLATRGDVSLGDLTDVFNELASYTQYHFSEEEKLMAEIAIDERHTGDHMKRHNEFLQAVLDLHQDMVMGREDAKGKLLTFLTDWLVHHILDCDMCLSRQIKAVQSGVPAAQAYEAEEK